jgi:hypothetical protein
MATYVWDFVVHKPAELEGNYYRSEHREYLEAQAKTDRDNTDQTGCKLSHTDAPHTNICIPAMYISSAMTDRGDGNRNGCVLQTEGLHTIESACPYDELIRKMIEHEQNRWDDHVLSW